MKKFSFLVLVMMLIVAFGCTKKIDTDAKDPAWDRDVCDRCAMQLGDKLHSAQVVNSLTGEHYYFDDFGCAVLWLSDTELDWKNKAIVYITDGAKGSWLKSDEAIFARDYITPMSFGVAAFKDKKDIEEGKTIISYAETVEFFKAVRDERKREKLMMEMEPMEEENNTDNMHNSEIKK